VPASFGQSKPMHCFLAEVSAAMATTSFGVAGRLRVAEAGVMDCFSLQGDIRTPLERTLLFLRETPQIGLSHQPSLSWAHFVMLIEASGFTKPRSFARQMPSIDPLNRAEGTSLTFASCPAARSQNVIIMESTNHYLSSPGSETTYSDPYTYNSKANGKAEGCNCRRWTCRRSRSSLCCEERRRCPCI